VPRVHLGCELDTYTVHVLFPLAELSTLAQDAAVQAFDKYHSLRGDLHCDAGRIDASGGHFFLNLPQLLQLQETFASSNGCYDGNRAPTMPSSVAVARHLILRCECGATGVGNDNLGRIVIAIACEITPHQKWLRRICGRVRRSYTTTRSGNFLRGRGWRVVCTSSTQSIHGP
jgi:hypothetical protein